MLSASGLEVVRYMTSRAEHLGLTPSQPASALGTHALSPSATISLEVYAPAAAMAARSHSRATVKTVHAASVARIHTYLAFSAFLSALVVGCLLHYTKIVKNGVAGYPEEWSVPPSSDARRAKGLTSDFRFPSVSATYVESPFPEGLSEYYC